MKSIEVVIGGRKYPVKVTAEEEKPLLTAIEEIEEKLHGFQSKYRGKDKQDYLSMALLTYALDNIKQKQDTKVSDQLNQQIDRIFESLESAAF